ncbi:MAG: translation initiation factor IF-5A [Nanoarchaeota archaeon]|nr:translation initiation factor IF-5A [Nanoarchaeota archaeon]
MGEGEKKQTNAGSLKPGNYVIIDGIACIVKSVQTSRTGKHGHAKCRIESVGMIDNQKKIIVVPAHDKIEVPIIIKKTAQVLSINNNVANVMDIESYETFDLKIPEDLKDKVTDSSQIVYWMILKEKVMKQLK